VICAGNVVGVDFTVVVDVERVVVSAVVVVVVVVSTVVVVVSFSDVDVSSVAHDCTAVLVR